MVFSSPVFLFIFFPLFYLTYLVVPKTLRNGLILIASIGFYVFGAGALTAVAIVMLVANWVIAFCLDASRKRSPGGRVSKTILLAAVALNLLPLAMYKYLLFFLQVWMDTTGMNMGAVIERWTLALPLGISFYTFHFISYIVDVYRGSIKPEKALHRFAIYIFLFPHLIAGPVVRFSEIAEQLHVRRRIIVQSDLFWGLVIFIIGLSKKILIADPLGNVVTLGHRPDLELTTYSAWLSSVCYSFQIYFDFSGYTDMAIGMARMMGFRFPKNFNRPYAAASITEFWQRWHMTLSRWFRDYLYIPLGGNRASKATTLRNLFIVFLLCGLWHGAAYTFLVWGVGHGLLIVAERAGWINLRTLKLGSFPVFILATLLWVPFRAGSMDEAIKFWSAMFGHGNDLHLWVASNSALQDYKTLALLVLAVVICFVSDGSFYRLRAKALRYRKCIALGCLVLYLCSAISVVESGFNPFIYFQF